MKASRKTTYILEIESAEWDKIWKEFYKIIEVEPIKSSPLYNTLHDWASDYFGDV